MWIPGSRREFDVEWTIEELGDGIWQITLTGKFDVQDYFSLVDEIEATAGGPHNRLWDLRNVDMRHATSKDIQQIVGQVRDAYSQVFGGKTAHLVTRGLTFGLSRMVSSYADDMPRKLRVFTDRDQAIKWLMKDDKDT